MKSYVNQLQTSTWFAGWSKGYPSTVACKDFHKAGAKSVVDTSSLVQSNFSITRGGGRAHTLPSSINRSMENTVNAEDCILTLV